VERAPIGCIGQGCDNERWVVVQPPQWFGGLGSKRADATPGLADRVID